MAKGRRSTLVSAALGVVVVASPVFAQNASVVVLPQPVGSSTGAVSLATPYLIFTADSVNQAGNATTSGSGQAGWNPSAASNPGSNPLIPSSLTPTCQAFLARLNSNTAVSQCTQPLVQATDLYSSSSNNTTTGPSQVKTVLDGLCGIDQQASCGDVMIRQVLSHFAGNCTQELAAGDEVVMGSYDVLYALNPFKKAICSRSALNGEYCLSSIASAASAINATSPSTNTTTNSTVTDNLAKNLLATPGDAVPDPAAPAPAGTWFSDMLADAGDQLAFVMDAGNGLTKRGFRQVFPRQAASGAGSAASAPSASASASGNRNVSASASASGAYGSKVPSSLSPAPSASVTASSGASSSPSTFSGPTLMPNTSTYTSTNLPFLFLLPTYPSSVLCTPCTTAILSAFVAFEQSIPYAGGSGLDDSRLLKGQVPLWKGVGQTCGTTFLSGIQKNAGSMALASAASPTTMRVGAVVAVVAVAFAGVSAWIV